jgi:dihydropteroate synthase
VLKQWLKGMTKLVAILNITPDSFSDGNKYLSIDDAISKTEELIKQGADIIDIGAESTRPGATPIDHTQEWQRVKNILPDIIKIAKQHNVDTSLDTRHYQTAEKAIKLGVNWINDVSGFTTLVIFWNVVWEQ